MPDESQPKYTRLAATQFVTFHRQSLWLGSDHLLCVEHRSFSDRYYRFYFHEIQALQFQRTSFRSILAWILGAVCALAAAALSQASLFLTVPALIILVSGSILLILHLTQGATCTCIVRTAVQQRRLNCLGRVRIAKRVLPQIQQLTTEAQADLPPVDEVIAALPERPEAVPDVPGALPSTQVRGLHAWSLAAGGSLLLQALCGGMTFLGLGEAIYGFLFLILLVLGTSLVAAIMHHRAGANGSGLVLALSWGGAGCQVLLGAIAYGAFFSWFLTSGSKSPGIGMENQLLIDFLKHLVNGGPDWFRAMLPALVAIVAILGVGILSGVLFGTRSQPGLEGASAAAEETMP